MDIRVSSSELDLRYTTRLLLRRMLSPLCGLDKGISFSSRSPLEPGFMSAGAELTGVHVLLNEDAPKQGAYHIGGSGVVREEALIRVLAETTERYSQVVSEVSGHHNIVMADYNRMVADGERVIAPDKLRFFSEAQYAQPGFPFTSFRPESPIGWLKAPSLLDDGAIWVPAQLILLGYRPKPHYDEPWLLSAVTTGTASHTRPELALRNALLELIQIDSAMGHWYSSATAARIILDDRTEAIRALIASRFDRRGPLPEFYWLPNSDLDVMAIACAIKGAPGRIPAVAIGLGCDLRLVDAMYKSLLEAVGVVQMAKVVLLHEALDENEATGNGIDPSQIFDLDRNVAFYAQPEQRSFIESKFLAHATIRSSELPPDSTLDSCQEIRRLVEQFRATNKEWVYLDLTTEDIRELGFVAVRVWSPDLISLCLPSAPPMCHPRFEAYGGATHHNPHPYP